MSSAVGRDTITAAIISVSARPDVFLLCVPYGVRAALWYYAVAALRALDDTVVLVCEGDR